jgi:hypothetical protein
MELHMNVLRILEQLQEKVLFVLREIRKKSLQTVQHTRRITRRKSTGVVVGRSGGTPSSSTPERKSRSESVLQQIRRTVDHSIGRTRRRRNTRVTRGRRRIVREGQFRENHEFPTEIDFDVTVHTESSVVVQLEVEVVRSVDRNIVEERERSVIDSEMESEIAVIDRQSGKDRLRRRGDDHPGEDGSLGHSRSDLEGEEKTKRMS